MTITRSEDYAWLHSGHLTVEFIAFPVNSSRYYAYVTWNS